MKHLIFNLKSVKKNTVLSLFVLAISLGVTAQNQSKDTGAHIDFESDVIDYGQILQNDEGERVFTFTNTGNAPLVISNVKSSCGCTVPTYPKTAVLPGQTGEITVSYDTNRLGAFSKAITVLSNADKPTKTLKIKGEILKKSI